MDDNEFLLFDRITKIQSVIRQYGAENFYISFSGGKDSTVLSALVDMAIPGNDIPRVYANTGIELNMVRDFVFKLQETDKRIQIIKPSVPIKKMLEKDGYPFKSKYHSMVVNVWQNRGIEDSETVKNYLELQTPKSGKKKRSDHLCPKVLRYQFYQGVPFKISDKCCNRLKKEPLRKFQKEHNKPYSIIGIMPAEGGQREAAKCLAFSGDKLKAFQPLVPITKEWEDWFIEKYDVEICDIYKPPYNFGRTGCKGCPFILNLQEQLDILDQYFPNERKQCEIIWKPVYDEYRRLKYRLKDGGRQMSIFDYIEEEQQ